MGEREGIGDEGVSSSLAISEADVAMPRSR